MKRPHSLETDFVTLVIKDSYHLTQFRHKKSQTSSFFLVEEHTHKKKTNWRMQANISKSKADHIKVYFFVCVHIQFFSSAKKIMEEHY